MKEKLLYAVVAGSLLAGAIPALAQTPPAGGPPPPPSDRPGANAVVDVTCIQNAIDKRDNAIIAAFDTYHAAVKSALEKRRDALKAAWAKTERAERRDAIKAAWQEYRKALRAAKKALKEARQAAWRQYAVDRKACKGGALDERISAGIDAVL